jgi:hypothetical protein
MSLNFGKIREKIGNYDYDVVGDSEREKRRALDDDNEDDDELKTVPELFGPIGRSWALARQVIRDNNTRTWSYPKVPASMFMVDELFVQHFNNYADFTSTLTQQQSQNAKIQHIILTFGSNMKKLDDNSELYIIWFNQSRGTYGSAQQGLIMVKRMVGFPLTDIHNTSSEKPQGLSEGNTGGIGMFVQTPAPISGYSDLFNNATMHIATSGDDDKTPDNSRPTTPTSPPGAPLKPNSRVQGAGRDHGNQRNMLQVPTEAPGARLKREQQIAKLENQVERLIKSRNDEIVNMNMMENHNYGGLYDEKIVISDKDIGEYFTAQRKIETEIKGLSEGNTGGIGMFVQTPAPVSGYSDSLDIGTGGDDDKTPDNSRPTTPTSPPGAPLKPDRRVQGAGRDHGNERKMLQMPTEAPGAPTKPVRDYGNQRTMLQVPTEAPGAPTKALAATEVKALPPKEVLDGYQNEDLRKLAKSRGLRIYGTREEVQGVLERWRRNTASG